MWRTLMLYLIIINDFDYIHIQPFWHLIYCTSFRMLKKCFEMIKEVKGEQI